MTEKAYNKTIDALKDVSFYGLGEAVKKYGTDISGSIDIHGTHEGTHKTHVQSSFGPIGGGTPIKKRLDIE